MAFDIHTLDVVGSQPGTPYLNRQDRVQFANFSMPNPSGPGTVSSVGVTSGGVFTSLPTLATSGDGSGDTFAPAMGQIAGTIEAAGSTYLAGDTITLADGGGTETAKTVITVDTVDGSGHVLTCHVSTAGSYTVLPTGNQSQSSTTSAAGTGFVWTPGTWKIVSVAKSGSGANYDSSSVLAASGGGMTVAPVLPLTLSQTAGASVSVAVSLQLPANYAVQIQCGQDAVAYVASSSKATSGFTITVNPRLAANALAAGTLDVTVFA